MSDKVRSGWIGVDLDGTLAHYDGWVGVHHIGEPIEPMLVRVKGWLAAGRTVKIFTARVAGHGMPIIGGGVEDAITPIREWCVKHLGQELEVTNVKDFGMVELWDDRAVQVEMNTGIPVAPSKARKRKPLGVRKCQRCGKANGKPDHTCPYSVDINDDHTSLCNCCEVCEGECADSI